MQSTERKVLNLIVVSLNLETERATATNDGDYDESV
jgi:hypothetical protein